MQTLPKYSSYTKTDINWITEFPSHWKLFPCRSIVEHIVEKNENAKIQNYLSLMANIGVIRYEDKGDVGNKKPEDLSKCKIVRKGQLVINSMNYSIGSYGMSPYDGVCSSVYIILEAKEEVLLNRYALRIFENTAFQKYLSTFGNGILAHRSAIGWDDIKGAYIPLAPMDEQKSILKFLDHETAQIDTLIEKQQTLIKLLKEKRQAVISHVVTKGLNPDAPMKDSGVEWLGEVPAHWVVATLRRVISRMEQGKSPQCESSPAKLDEWGVLKTSCVNGGRFNEEENKLLPSHIAPHEEYEVQAGDLLMSRASGSINLIGSVVLVQDNVRTKLLLSDKIFRIYLSENYDSLFFAYLMSSSYIRSSIEIAISGAEGMANNIAKSSIMEFIIPILPLDEQVEIASYLKVAETKYMALISKAEQAIQLMQERRTALISAAVTGKIDVRGWVAPDNA